MSATLPEPSEDVRAWDAFFSMAGLLPPGADARSMVLAAMGDESNEDANVEVPDSGVLRHVDEAVRQADNTTRELGTPTLLVSRCTPQATSRSARCNA